MNFQGDIPSIPIDKCRCHFLLVFDLTAVQDATEVSQYPKLVGEPLRLEINFSFPLENVTEFIVLGERIFSVKVDKCGVVGKKWTMFPSYHKIRQTFNRTPLLKYQYLGSLPFDNFQILTVTLLQLYNCNPAKCMVSIG